MERSENREYSEWFAKFDLHQIDENGEVGEYLGVLRPARRAYHGANVRLSRQTTEKDEIFMWKGNVYLSIVSFSPQLMTCEVTAHYNPMILFMWLGGAMLLFGVAVVLWPDPVAYPVFAAARRRKRDEVASGVSVAPLGLSGDSATSQFSQASPQSSAGSE